MGSAWSDVIGDSSSEDGHNDPLRWEGSYYHPTSSDVDIVENGLVKLGLPVELALYILDLAEYWVREILCERAGELVVKAIGSPKNSSTWCYLVSPPLSCRPRKIRFHVLSHDQGWGGPPDCRKTFRGSFSWTEVALMRPKRTEADNGKRLPANDEKPAPSSEGALSDAPYLPGRLTWVEATQAANFVDVTSDDPNDIALDDPLYEPVEIDGRTHRPLQHNRVAVRASESHEIEWREDEGEVEEYQGDRSDDTGAGYGGGFVRAIQEGDCIAVFARAQYPGWECHVEAVTIETFTGPGLYQPTPSEVNVVKTGLLKRGLPTELALHILDYAKYWTRETFCERTGNLVVKSIGTPNESSTWCYLVSPPLESKPRKLRFHVTSHDQGGGGEHFDYYNLFRGSHSWFEVALMRPRRLPIDESDEQQVSEAAPSWVEAAQAGDADFVDATAADPGAIALTSPRYEPVRINGLTHAPLQCNRVAVDTAERHTIEWRVDEDDVVRKWGIQSEDTGSAFGGGFVRAARPGDCIAVFARARGPGWENHVEAVTIEAFTGILTLRTIK
ncbi:uncharacterized protein SCHCODRAFT_02692011 [Schizophyllum commune H4-8]|uniref:Uncharacterized protein n=1 Tax=Schizophyllum commune (strain H4-8 / FGSC 9210) TaxID=578458 RepID=D8QDH5_SCHCM|nr:uncharacterized protein SCHCODRAFT_02692011 [Schizophyllum commune H4-8]KAI5888715.1 hypothetical protein SCHCODRAFT_02692011 [Schizophyllum commune H4-8]